MEEEIEIKDKDKLTKGAKVLIADQAIGKIIGIFLDIFFVAYFYNLTENNVYCLALYNIVTYIVLTISAWIVSTIVKKVDKIKFYRFGTIVKAIYILIIIILGPKIVNIVPLLGTLNGLQCAFSAFVYNMIESEQITKRERAKYSGLASLYMELIGLVAPIMLGAYIDASSYEVAAIAILVFTIIKLLNTFQLKNKKNVSKKLNMKEFLGEVKKDKTLKKLYAAEFFKGINGYGVMVLVVSLLIIANTENDLEIGWASSIFSMLTIITMFLFSRFYKDKIRNKLMILSVLFLTASCIFVVSDLTLISVLVYNVCFYVFMNLVIKITEVTLFNYSTTKRYKDEFNTEYFLGRETILNTARILGYTLLLLFVGLTRNMANLKYLFIVIIVSVIVMIAIYSFIKPEELIEKKEIK